MLIKGESNPRLCLFVCLKYDIFETIKHEWSMDLGKDLKNPVPDPKSATTKESFRDPGELGWACHNDGCR